MRLKGILILFGLVFNASLAQAIELVDHTVEYPSISDDGRWVAYETSGSPIGGDRVMVKDLTTGDSTIVHLNNEGNGNIFRSYRPSISGNGRFIAFQSHATNLVPGDTNCASYCQLPDIFVYDRQTGITERVNLNSNGAQTNNNAISHTPVISQSGRYVGFFSNATNLVDVTNLGNALLVDGTRFHLYLRDRLTGITKLVNISPSADILYMHDLGLNDSPKLDMYDISEIGERIYFYAYTEIYADGATAYLYNIATGQSETVAPNVYRAKLSADGNSLTYSKYDSSASTYRTYIYDMSTGTTELIDIEGRIIDVSGDARFLLLSSGKNDLLDYEIYSGSSSHEYIHDRETGINKMVDVSETGHWANNGIWTARISADGTTIVLHTPATNLINNNIICCATQIFAVKTSQLAPTKRFTLWGYDNVDPASESGIYISQSDESYIKVRVTAGGANENGQSVLFSGSFIGEDEIILSPSTNSLESNDYLSQINVNQIDFELKARRPYSDAFDFEISNDRTKSLCIHLENYAGGLFLGGAKVEVTSPYDIINQMACETPGTTVDGKPTIDRAVDQGWFLWRENEVWRSEFVAGGTSHVYQGGVTSSGSLTNILPISLESNDVFNASGGELSFELLVTGPWYDGLQFMSQATSQSCVYMNGPSGVNIYLGPDAVMMPSSFDLDTLQACQSEPNIETQGKPSIDRSSDVGIFIWENTSDNWAAEVVSGDGARTIELDVNAVQSISNVVPVNIESSDVFTILPNGIDMTLKVNAPWMDGFRFTDHPQSNTCVSTTSADMSIFLGPNRVNVGNNVNLHTLADCL